MLVPLPIRAAALLLALTAPAAGAAEWDAHLVEQSPPPGTLEAGQVVQTWMKVQNTGTATWVPGGGDLAAITPGAAPADRTSPFASLQWRDAMTPAQLRQPLTAGNVGTFEFELKAPGPGTYDEHFAVRGENGTWPGAAEGWHIPVTVVAAEPPRVEFTQAPAKIRGGESANVAVRATDNVGVTQVTFALGEEMKWADAEPWAATLSPSNMPSGRYTIRATAHDRAGHQTVVEHPFDFEHVVHGPLSEEQLSLGGLPSEAPRITPYITMSYGVANGRLNISRAHVSRAPKGAKVVLRAGRLRQTLIARGRTVPLSKLRNRTLKPGAVVEITATKPGMTGGVLRATVARRPTAKRPWGTEKRLCLFEGSKTPRTCG